MHEKSLKRKIINRRVKVLCAAAGGVHHGGRWVREILRLTMGRLQVQTHTDIGQTKYFDDLDYGIGRGSEGGKRNSKTE